jgi:hypothetical protein
VEQLLDILKWGLVVDANRVQSGSQAGRKVFSNLFRPLNNKNLISPSSHESNDTF